MLNENVQLPASVLIWPKTVSERFEKPISLPPGLSDFASVTIETFLVYPSKSEWADYAALQA